MFDIYIALGDSMSIDFYPAQDAERAGILTRDDIGAAALLYRNDPALFPEFAGQDLVSWLPDIKYLNLAFDGAVCEDLLSPERLEEIRVRPRARALVTLTLGGNDLLDSYRRSSGKYETWLFDEISALQSRYQKVVSTIKSKCPKCILMLTTVFDPTDGTGIMPSTTPLFEAPLAIEYLSRFNDFIRSFAERDQLILVADVHKHFRGHGAECGAADQFWYWKPNPIEPSYRGASEIRRVWLQLLQGSAGMRE